MFRRLGFALFGEVLELRSGLALGQSNPNLTMSNLEGKCLVEIVKVVVVNTQCLQWGHFSCCGCYVHLCTLPMLPNPYLSTYTPTYTFAHIFIFLATHSLPPHPYT